MEKGGVGDGNPGAVSDHSVVFPKTSNVNMSEMNVCHLAAVTALPWRDGMFCQQ